MELYFPCLLPRKKAMLCSGLSRTLLEQLAKTGVIRTYTTKGNHKRYFRDDLINFINEKIQQQQRR